MVRKEWRKKVLARRAWRADVDATALDEVNGALNDAIRKLAGDCPAAFVPDVEHVVVFPDQTQVTMGRGVTATADPYVLSFGLSVAGFPNPDVTGAWDGIFHIEVQTPDGRWHRRQCREFWVGPAVVPPTPSYIGQWLVSIDRPWGLGGVEMPFRLHQPEFFFKDDVTEVLDGKVWDASGDRFFEASARAVSEWNEDDYQGRVKGRPDKMTRGRHFQLVGPAIPPVISKPDVAWVGKEPLGTFRFAYSYVWGKIDPERTDEFGVSDPVWESSLSPVSDAVVLSSAGSQIQIGALVNIDYMINFDPPAGATVARAGHSGLRKRIYVFRDATDTTGAFVDEVEPRSVGYLLVEVDGTTVSYNWDGSVIPNPFRRAPEVTGYFAHCLVPHQDKRYEIDFRVRRKQGDLVNDYDAPRVQPQSEEALNLLALHYVAQLDKQPIDAARYMAQYLGGQFEGVKYPGELPKLLALWGNTAKVLPGSVWGVPRGNVGDRWQRRDGNYFKA